MIEENNNLILTDEEEDDQATLDECIELGRRDFYTVVENGLVVDLVYLD